MSGSSPWVSVAASFIGPLITLFGIFVAMSKAKKELAKWRDEKRETKRAEVAGESLVACLRFLSGLEEITSIFSKSSAEEEEDDSAAFRREVVERWTNFSNTSERFKDAWQLAQTYLPDEVCNLLEEIWQESSSIWASQTTFFMTPKPDGASFFKEGFGATPKKRLSDLKVRCRKLLRPVAQLQVLR